jgi:hypothetical protein
VEDGTAQSAQLDQEDGDLGESMGVGVGVGVEESIMQTSHIDDEVKALSSEVASLTQDSANVMSTANTDTGSVAKHEDKARAEKDTVNDVDSAPAPSDDADSNMPLTSDAMKTDKDVGDSSEEAVGAPTPPPTISPADAAAQQQQIAAQEQAAQNAADASEASSLSSVENTAENDAETATKAQQGAAATLIMSEAPKPYPEAPEPVIQVSAAVVNARKEEPMVAPRVFENVVADATYKMGGGAAAEEEEALTQQHIRDVRISENGGKISRILPAEDPKYVNNDDSAFMTTDGPQESYAAPTHQAADEYCSAYVSRRNSAKPKWTKKYCEPTESNFEEIMKNVDAVVCACGGVKTANIPSGAAHPGIQESVYSRAQVDRDRIRSYAYRLSSNVDPAAPRPAYGLTWEVRLTDEAATMSDHEVNPREMQTMYITFNRITEFMDHARTGLDESTLKQKDLTTGGLWNGIECDAGKQTWKNQGDKNCVLQDFFLDKFHLADLKVDGEKYRFSFASDIQGTSPWCGKDKDECAQPPVNKPNVTFAIESSAGSFTDSKMSISVNGFPYKAANSSLAFSASVFASSVAPKMDQFADGTDCTVSPLPAACPTVTMADKVQFSWSKTVKDTLSSKTFKVTAAPVRRYKSGVSSSNGMRLIHKKMVFSFKHGNAKNLLWDPKINVDADPLPRNLKKSAAPGWTQPVFSAILALALACIMLQNR